MKSITSQATRRAALAQSVKLQVIQLLDISELDYGTIQFQTGECYLSLLFSDQYYESLLLHDRVFWNWWKNQWLLRDEQFLSAVMYSDILIDQEGRFCLDRTYKGYPGNYLHFHDPTVLLTSIRPNKKILLGTWDRRYPHNDGH